MSLMVKVCPVAFRASLRELAFRTATTHILCPKGISSVFSQHPHPLQILTLPLCVNRLLSVCSSSFALRHLPFLSFCSLPPANRHPEKIGESLREGGRKASRSSSKRFRDLREALPFTSKEREVRYFQESKEKKRRGTSAKNGHTPNSTSRKLCAQRFSLLGQSPTTLRQMSFRLLLSEPFPLQ